MLRNNHHRLRVAKYDNKKNKFAGGNDQNACQSWDEKKFIQSQIVLKQKCVSGESKKLWLLDAPIPVFWNQGDNRMIFFLETRFLSDCA